MSDNKTIDVVHIGKLHVPSDRDYVLDIVSDASATSTGILQTPQGHTIDSTASGLEVAGALIVPDGIEADIDGDVVGTLEGQWYLDKGTYDPENPDTDDLYAYLSPTGEIGAAQIRIGEMLNSAPTAQIDENGDAILHSVLVGMTGAEVAEIDATGNLSALTLTSTTVDHWPLSLLPADHTGAEWTGSTSLPGYVLPANLGGKVLWGKNHALAHGAIATGWEVKGTCTVTGATTLTAGLYQYLDGVETLIGTLDADAIATGNFVKTQTFGAEHTLAAGAAYAVKMTGTTAVGDAITVYYAELFGKFKA